VNYAGEEKGRQEDYQENSKEDNQEGCCEEDLHLHTMRHRGDSDKARNGCHPPDVLRSRDEAEEYKKMLSRIVRFCQP
jgi:hypothetical protein